MDLTDKGSLDEGITSPLLLPLPRTESRDEGALQEQAAASASGSNWPAPQSLMD